jgi:hypothetical protein
MRQCQQAGYSFFREINRNIVGNMRRKALVTAITSSPVQKAEPPSGELETAIPSETRRVTHELSKTSSGTYDPDCLIR